MKRFIAAPALALLLVVASGSIEAQQTTEKSQKRPITMGMMWSGTGDGKGAKCPMMAGTGMGGAMKRMMGLAPRNGGKRGMGMMGGGKRPMQPAAPASPR